VLTRNVFAEKSIADIHAGYKNKSIEPTDVAQYCIDRVEEFDARYNAWVCFDKEILLKQAQDAQKRIQSGEELRYLEGIPIGIKDIMNTHEFPTQMGSPLWKEFTPGNDARVVYYARSAGGMIPGKTETAEFAVHTLGDTINPYDPTRTPGTSSSGSAVAIALGMVPVALGTQTAGSIVRPASFCGIYGCKPSFGLIPRTGLLKTTDSLDTVGYFVNHFEDLERVFEVVRVHGPNYPMSHRALKDEKRQNKTTNRPWCIALVKTHTWQYTYDYAKKALMDWASRINKDVEIDVVEARLPANMENTHDIHAAIYNKTLSYYFKEEFKRAELVSPIMNDLIRQGNETTVEQYHRALASQTDLIYEMDEFFDDYDILISLSTAGEAPPREQLERPDPALMWTMTHLPVISVPAFTSPEGLPFGLQLVARKYNDLLLFRFAEYLCSMGYIPKSANSIESKNLLGVEKGINPELS
jgi:Asp-tRNA(Asn)/Glu-tRNA(Gln) amidotransferase A subunit family amidase